MARHILEQRAQTLLWNTGLFIQESSYSTDNFWVSCTLTGKHNLTLWKRWQMQFLVDRKSASMNLRTMLCINRAFILAEKRHNEQQKIEIRHSLQQQWCILVKWKAFYSLFYLLIDVTQSRQTPISQFPDIWISVDTALAPCCSWVWNTTINTEQMGEMQHVFK